MIAIEMKTTSGDISVEQDETCLVRDIKFCLACRFHIRRLLFTLLQETEGDAMATEVTTSRFGEVFLERSRALHALFVKFMMPQTKASTVGLFFATERLDAFRTALATSSLFVNLDNQVTLAHAFARNLTNGLGGDVFQRFVANHAPWSRLTGVKAKAATLEAFKDLLSNTLALDFVGILLPMYSSAEGHALLLFRWEEHNLATPGQDGLTTFYVGVLVTVVDAAAALAGVRTELESDTGVVAQCELLPARWLLPPKGTERAAKYEVHIGAEMALTFETVRNLGMETRWHYVSMCMLDAQLLHQVEKKEGQEEASSNS